MISSVKGSGQVQESKKGNFVVVKAKKNVINYPQESCFSAVWLPICWLVWIQEVIVSEVV